MYVYMYIYICIRVYIWACAALRLHNFSVLSSYLPLPYFLCLSPHLSISDWSRPKHYSFLPLWCLFTMFDVFLCSCFYNHALPPTPPPCIVRPSCQRIHSPRMFLSIPLNSLTILSVTHSTRLTTIPLSLSSLFPHHHLPLSLSRSALELLTSLICLCLLTAINKINIKA